MLSTYCNRLLCPFPEYRAFLNYMTRSDMFLFDVARARVVVAAHLERALPQLRDIPPVPEKTDSGNAARYVKSCLTTLGAETIPLRPMRTHFGARTVEEHYALT